MKNERVCADSGRSCASAPSVRLPSSTQRGCAAGMPRHDNTSAAASANATGHYHCFVDSARSTSWMSHKQLNSTHPGDVELLTVLSRLKAELCLSCGEEMLAEMAILSKDLIKTHSDCH